jgi:hypothetical protein
MLGCDNNCAENHYWQHLGVDFTADLLKTVPAIGSADPVPFFVHGRFVDRFWYDGEIEKYCATFHHASADILTIEVELAMLLLSIEDGKVIGLHFPTID